MLVPKRVKYRRPHRGKMRGEAKGGKTVYFGDMGEDSRTLIDFFERNGSRRCNPSENPCVYTRSCVYIIFI